MKALVDKHNVWKDRLKSKEEELEYKERALIASRNNDSTRIRELEYRNNHLSKELVTLKSLYKKSQEKIKSQEIHIMKSLQQVKKNEAFVISTAKNQIVKLKRDTLNLEKHISSCQKGSMTLICQQLFAAMNLSITSLGTLMINSISRDKNNENLLEEDENLLSSEHIFNSKHDEIMQSLCDKLQHENSILNSKIYEVLATNEKLRERARISEALIPQYRLAVSKSRSHAAALRQRLSEEAANVVRLKRQVISFPCYFFVILIKNIFFRYILYLNIFSCILFSVTGNRYARIL